MVWSSEAIQSLFHFMRCSQLEYGHGAEGHPPIQELVYERPYMVLPPIMEWVRVATCFAEHRNSCVVDDNDVLQAARYPIQSMILYSYFYKQYVLGYTYARKNMWLCDETSGVFFQSFSSMN